MYMFTYMHVVTCFLLIVLTLVCTRGCPLYRYSNLFCQLNFSVCKFVFSPRFCNKVAHALAALGEDGACPCRVWHEDVPDFEVLVASDSSEPMN
jgi:hypothetical protein